MKRIILLFIMAISMMACNENYSNGERIGLVTQFAKAGNFFKSWEGHLNMTQTGMNSSQPFDFSIDNDEEPPGLAATIDSAAQYGWKVKLKYHATFGKNWFHNRGSTDHFVTSCEILDKNPMQTALGSGQAERKKERDTFYMIIVNPEK